MSDGQRSGNIVGSAADAANVRTGAALNGGADLPNPVELVLAVLTGAGHVALELATQGMRGAAESLGRPQHLYNVSAGAVWGVYLVWRLVRTRGTAAAWGFRGAGFRRAMRASLLFAAIALLPLLAFGYSQGRLPLPRTFWLVAAVYPLYGLAQQFVLQGLITRNLRRIVPASSLRVLSAATLFSVSHFPNYRLVALTFPAGLAFTWIFEKYRNLWAVGIVHGILGALAYYAVLGQDPGAQLLKLIGCVSWS